VRFITFKFLSKKMRVFDTFTEPTKLEILSNSIAFGKAELISEGKDPNIDVVERAIGFVWQYGITEPDYILIPDIYLINSWMGPIPIKTPRP
jgi:hypothetical protein